MIAYDSRRWLQHLFMLRGSVIPLILPKVIFLSAVSAVATVLTINGWLPQLPLAAFTTLGIALGLLLTLRTTTSYDRFWEGRKAWGTIVNRSRSLLRQTRALSKDDALVRRLGQLVASFAHAARRQLRGEAEIPELVRLLGEKESATCQLPPGPAQRCLLLASELLADARRRQQLDSIEVARLEEDLTQLVDQLGACERIKKTQIPLAYVLHLRRFLLLYCTFLTQALVEDFGMYTPIAIAFVAYVFLGIERVGVEIEDPFENTHHDIDLDVITATIERDVLAY